MDTDIENCFIVTRKSNGKSFKFKASKEGLYFIRPSEGFIDEIARLNSNQQANHLVSTVKENREGFSDKQFQRACLTRKI